MTMISITKKNLIECDLSVDNELDQWGIDDVAYLKKDIVNNEEVWSIYAAEGTRMGYAADRQVALALISQNDLTPMSVH